MRVAVIQLAYTDSEPMAERIHRVASLVESQEGADLVVLPELWSAGGFDYPAWPDKAQDVEGPVAQALSEAAANLGAYVHAGSIIEKSGEPGAEGRGLWNTSMVFDPDGELVGTYRKIHRFGFGNGEPKLLEAGEDVVVLDFDEPSSGDESGSNSVKVGLATCYDLRFPELFRKQVDEGAEIFVIPAAWPAARIAAWRTLLQARAIENQVFVIACNTAGTHAKTEMGGNSAVISPSGEVLAEAGRGERVLTLDIDVDEVRAARESFPVLSDRRL
ncbi:MULTISPECIES: carbon-nitrogen family hydrolase [Dermacoccus]|uniref:Carbon-nitrogen family hydrolase n=2 Tax=Dermacoccus TaxID=57495 RepID=A0A417Z7N5_9MICO|nr:carbon-nitrogen family hydrolase [Dermacoccus abyssi]RHW46650.1 carbon-nitrogen family hydrolase [Dermacoccus abyssi]